MRLVVRAAPWRDVGRGDGRRGRGVGRCRGAAGKVHDVGAETAVDFNRVLFDVTGCGDAGASGDFDFGDLPDTYGTTIRDGDTLDYKPVRTKPLSVESFPPKARTY